MTKMIMTMIVFTSSVCLGFTNQEETNIPIPEKHNSTIEQEDTIDSEATSAFPVLEKCKKKKK